MSDYPPSLWCKLLFTKREQWGLCKIKRKKKSDEPYLNDWAIDDRKYVQPPQSRFQKKLVFLSSLIFYSFSPSTWTKPELQKIGYWTPIYFRFTRYTWAYEICAHNLWTKSAYVQYTNMLCRNMKSAFRYKNSFRQFNISILRFKIFS